MNPLINRTCQVKIRFILNVFLNRSARLRLVMDPHKEFVWCLRFVRGIFNILGQDVFETTFRYTIRYILVATIGSSAAVLCIYTIFWTEGVSIFFSIEIFFSVLLVKTVNPSFTICSIDK